MSDRILDYLEANKEVVTKIDATQQSATAVQFWKQLKEKAEKDFGKRLITPVIYYSGNTSSDLVFRIYWVKDNSYLSFEISSDNNQIIEVYYIADTSLNENLEYITSPEEYQYTLGTPLPEKLINTLLLFTE